MSVSAGGRTLLDDVTWQLGPGDRIGVVGVNGSGKTTLLNLLARGDDPAGTATAGLKISGEVVTGKTVRIGYLTQEPRPVDPGLRALEAAQQVRGSVQVGKGELSASQLLERLGLSGDRQWTPVAELSGGERRRLQLQMLLMAEPNVLLLDEPTNDLDIDTLTELEDLLDGFPGSIVVVSHDRYFLERVTDRVLALIDAGLAFLPGGVDEYLERLDADEAGKPAGQAGRAGAAVGGRAAAGRAGAARRRRAAGGQEGAGQARPAAPAPGQPGSPSCTRRSRGRRRLRPADRARRRTAGVQAEKAALEDRWLELAEESAP